MDLYNNELGFVLGEKNKQLSLEVLSQLVIKEIASGKALIMKRNKKGSYLDCNNEVVVLPAQKKWSVNKCLVASDYNYND